MTVSNRRQLQILKALVKDYYALPYQFHIEKHLELLRLFKIIGKQKDNHPHRDVLVYISRKSLKHFVESRKFDLNKRHNDQKTLEMMHFAIESTEDIIEDFDIYNQEIGNKFSYTRRCNNLRNRSIRIIFESVREHLEIISIHFTKIKKPLL